MITSKNRVPKLAAVAAMMLLPLLQTLSAGGGQDRQIELTYTKWLVSGINYTGEVGGDIDGVLATKLFSAVPPDPLPADNDIRQLEVEFKILAGAQTFTALLSGHLNNGTRTGVLNGVVTEGFREGARVHVEFDFTVAEGPGPFTECPRRVCYAGTIRVMPN